jgi:hypothetical protein
MYDDRNYEFVKDDFIHKNELPTEQTKDFLEGIKDALYVTGDVESLENCVEELCALYEVKFEDKQLIFEIRRRALRTLINDNEKQNLMLRDHIDEQRKMIDRLLGRDDV